MKRQTNTRKLYTCCFVYYVTGECVLSLKQMFTDEPQAFSYTLTHQGEETGKIRYVAVSSLLYKIHVSYIYSYCCPGFSLKKVCNI